METGTRKCQTFFKKWANPSLLIVYFRFFLNTISIIQTEKSVDGVVGIQTHGRRMVGPDDTTELWGPPSTSTVFVALLVEQLLPTPEICSLIQVMGNFYLDHYLM